MKAILIPVVLLLVGTGAGVGAGLLLGGPGTDQGENGTHVAGDAVDGPPAEAADHADSDKTAAENAGSNADQTEEEESENEFVKLNNQFVVPVVEQGRVAAMVVMSLNLEVTTGSREEAFTREPKIRDAFIQVLFDHANIGGFSGNFTSSSNMRVLREDLRAAAREVMGERLIDVLIIDVMRQDIQS